MCVTHTPSSLFSVFSAVTCYVGVTIKHREKYTIGSVMFVLILNLNCNAQSFSNCFRHIMMWREVSMTWQSEDSIVMEPPWVVSMPSVNTFGSSDSFGNGH